MNAGIPHAGDASCKMNVFGFCGGENLSVRLHDRYLASRRQGRLLFLVQKYLGRPSR